MPPPDWGHAPSGRDGGADQLDQLRAEFYGVPGGLGVRAGGGVAVGAILGGAIYVQAGKMLGPQDHFGAGAIAAIVGVAAAWGFFRLNVRAPDMGRAAERFIRCRLCICCGYDLRAVTAQADGCTVCPECGAAWGFGPPEPGNRSAGGE